MPIYRKPDGTMMFDTVDEAIEYERKNNRPVSRQRASPHSIDQLTPGRSLEATQLLAKLKPYNGMILDSGQMMGIVGADSRLGVGPKLRSLRNSFQRENLSLDSYIQARDGANGTKVWKIILPPEEA